MLRAVSDWWIDLSSAARKFILGALAVVAVTGIILFAVSFDTITPHEYGVRYSTYSHRVDQETYDNGRYLLGIGHYFFKYPRRLVYTEFSGASDTNPPVSVWSNDGQSLDVEVGFYFRIHRENVMTVFNNYKTSWRGVFENVAEHAIKDVATQFPTEDFFTQRAAVNTAMNAELTTRFEALGCEVVLFNLLDIALAAPFEDAVVDKVVKAQERLIKQYQQQSSVIQKQTELILATAQRDIRVIQAVASATGLVIRANATATAFQTFTEAQGRIYANFSTHVGFASAPDAAKNVLQYVWADTLQQQGQGSKLVVGFDKPIIKL